MKVLNKILLAAVLISTISIAWLNYRKAKLHFEIIWDGVSSRARVIPTSNANFSLNDDQNAIVIDNRTVHQAIEVPISGLGFIIEPGNGLGRAEICNLKLTSGLGINFFSWTGSELEKWRIGQQIEKIFIQRECLVVSSSGSFPQIISYLENPLSYYLGLQTFFILIGISVIVLGLLFLIRKLPNSSKTTTVFLIGILILHFLLVWGSASYISRSSAQIDENYRIRRLYDTRIVDHLGRPLTSRLGPISMRLDSFVGYRLMDSQSSLVTLNSSGYRMVKPDGDPDRPKLMFTGGSTMYGFGSTSDATTLASFVAGQIRYKVFNTSAPGYNSDNEAALVFNDLEDIQPKWVVSFTGYNDLTSFYSCLPKCNRITMGHFVLDEAEAELYKYFDRNEPSVAKQFSELKAHFWTEAQVLDFAVVRFLRNMERIKKWAALSESKTVIFIQPIVMSKLKKTHAEHQHSEQIIKYFEGKWSKSFEEIYRTFRKRILAECAKRLLTCYDLNNSAPVQESSEEIFFDGVHFTDVGNRLFADEIVARMNLSNM